MYGTEQSDHRCATHNQTAVEKSPSPTQPLPS
jgi:hypothetical protein